MVENSGREPQGVLDESHFVENMQRLREQNGWSQGELARRVTELGFTGFHQTTISRIEKAERPVRLSEARGIADAFGKSLDEMLAVPESESLLHEIRSAVERMRNAETQLWRAADEHESSRAIAARVALNVNDRLSALFPKPSVDSGKYLYWINELRDAEKRLPDAVIREFMEKHYGEHQEET